MVKGICISIVVYVEVIYVVEVMDCVTASMYYICNPEDKYTGKLKIHYILDNIFKITFFLLVYAIS